MSGQDHATVLYGLRINHGLPARDLTRSAVTFVIALDQKMTIGKVQSAYPNPSGIPL
jgi:hypothetical protein